MRRRRWLLGGVAVVVAATATAVVARSSGTRAETSAQQAVMTVPVVRGNLSSIVSAAGIVAYRARPDGTAYSVINQAHGTFTMLPAEGDTVPCGDVLYRVDDKPVLLLCGAVPAYRDLRAGDAGSDVLQLNQNLHELGVDAGAEIDPADDNFTAKTQTALEALQRDKGADGTGVLMLGDAVFLPEALRITKVTSEFGGSALPGAPVAQATSDTPEIHVDLEPSQQRVVTAGARVEIALPTNASATGKVDRLGAVAQIRQLQNGTAGAATIPAFITLDDPTLARGLDQAAVQVQITTGDVENVLSVPVTALVGTSGGGFAVEVVRNGGRHELVAVTLGLFDTAGGRVQVDGDGLHEGDQVVVPSA